MKNLLPQSVINLNQGLRDQERKIKRLPTRREDFDKYAKMDANFFKNHYKNLREDFINWWLNYYGNPSVYITASKKDGIMEEDVLSEYFIRCAFALIGWNSKPELNNNIVNFLSRGY
jgi:hypothetical protein